MREGGLTKAAKTPRPSKTGWPEWRDAPGAIQELCAEIANGNNLQRWIDARGFKYQLVRDWISADPAREADYARAREARADLLFDEIVAIADEVTVENVLDQDGNVVDVKMDATAVARNRLRVDARKWAASKLKPKAYGDKQTLVHEVASLGDAVRALDGSPHPG